MISRNGFLFVVILDVVTCSQKIPSYCIDLQNVDEFPESNSFVRFQGKMGL